MKVKKAVIVVAIAISIVIIAFILYMPNSNTVDNINPIAKISMTKTTLYIHPSSINLIFLQISHDILVFHN